MNEMIIFICSRECVCIGILELDASDIDSLINGRKLLHAFHGIHSILSMLLNYWRNSIVEILHTPS